MLFSVQTFNFSFNFTKLDGKSQAIESAITAIFGFQEFLTIVLICEPGERVANQFE